MGLCSRMCGNRERIVSVHSTSLMDSGSSAHVKVTPLNCFVFEYVGPAAQQPIMHRLLAGCPTHTVG
jgi:hypothetical protein